MCLFVPVLTVFWFFALQWALQSGKIARKRVDYYYYYEMCI